MNKFFALILVLCMMTVVLPAVTESAAYAAGFSLNDMISDILKSGENAEETTGKLLTLISDLKKQFTGHEAELSVLLSRLGQKLGDLVSSDEKGLGSLVSGLKDKLAGGSDTDLSGLISGLRDKLNGDSGSDLAGLLGGLSGLFGSEGGNDGWTEEDQQELNDLIDQLNKEAEASTGENVPNRKLAESIDEFYGSWIETKFIYDDEEYDMTDSGEGVFIAENTYYITQNGEKDPDYPYPETAEISLRDGVLKVKRGENNWTTYVLTENGEIVMDGSFLAYFTRVSE